MSRGWVRFFTFGVERLDHTLSLLSLGLVYTSWDGFDRVWNAVYAKTGGRIRQMVLGPLGLVVVDETSRLLTRWSHCLSRSEARASTQGSPHVVRVLLRDFF